MKSCLKLVLVLLATPVFACYDLPNHDQQVDFSDYRMSKSCLRDQVKNSKQLTSLDLSHNTLGDEFTSELLSSIQEPQLEQLNLAANSLQGSDAFWLALSQHQGLQLLNLSLNDFKQADCVASSKALAQLPLKRLSLATTSLALCEASTTWRHLTWLDLSNHAGEQGSLESWLRNLPRMKNLRHLILNHHVFSTSELKALENYLLTNPGLESLELGDIRISSSQWQVLIPHLSHLSHLKSLSLFGNKLHGETVKLLIKALSHHSHLTHLDLSGNALDAPAIHLLGHWLETQALRVLSLRLNSLGPQAIEALTQALEKNTSLESIDLAHTDLAGDGVVRLMKSLSGLSRLSEVSLASNPGLKAHVATLSEWIANQSQLVSIDLSQNAWVDSSAAIIAQGIKENQSLEHIYLIDTRLQDKSAMTLAQAIDFHPRLIHLGLEWNDISEEGFRALEQLLIDESPLKSLRFSDEMLVR